MKEPDKTSMLPVYDLFAYLKGNWKLTRKITDIRLNILGFLSGTISITRESNKAIRPTLAYHEEGELCFGNYKEKVYRDYRFCFPNAHSALVFFSDGKIFHKLDLTTGFCRVEHLCLEDLYQGRFCVESSNVWLSKWHVSGPAKQMILDNHYQRRE